MVVIGTRLTWDNPATLSGGPGSSCCYDVGAVGFTTKQPRQANGRMHADEAAYQSASIADTGNGTTGGGAMPHGRS